MVVVWGYGCICNDRFFEFRVTKKNMMNSLPPELIAYIASYCDEYTDGIADMFHVDRQLMISSGCALKDMIGHKTDEGAYINAALSTEHRVNIHGIISTVLMSLTTYGGIRNAMTRAMTFPKKLYADGLHVLSILQPCRQSYTNIQGDS